MRTVRTGSTKLTIVVAVVTIRAQNLRPHRAARRNSIEVQHVRQQAGLRECAAPCVGHRMARGRRNRELRNQVERIAGRNRSHRKVSINRQNLFARAGSMAAQAALILIHCGCKHRGSVARADARDVLCEIRISGAGGNTPTGSDPCALWQSTQVAWRLLFSRALSVASCGFVEAGKGCPTFGVAYSANTFAYGAIGETFAPPLWQEMQSCSFWPRSNRAVHLHCAASGTRCTHRQPRWDSFPAEPAERSCLWKARARL